MKYIECLIKLNARMSCCCVMYTYGKHQFIVLSTLRIIEHCPVQCLHRFQSNLISRPVCLFNGCQVCAIRLCGKVSVIVTLQINAQVYIVIRICVLCQSRIYNFQMLKPLMWPNALRYCSTCVQPSFRIDRTH